VPAVVKRMAGSSPASASIAQISDHATNSNGRNDDISFSPPAVRELEPSSDTQAVLEQLAAIQRVFLISINI
jgi:hypothetical protein